MTYLTQLHLPDAPNESNLTHPDETDATPTTSTELHQRSSRIHLIMNSEQSHQNSAQAPTRIQHKHGYTHTRSRSRGSISPTAGCLLGREERKMQGVLPYCYRKTFSNSALHCHHQLPRHIQAQSQAGSQSFIPPCLAFADGCCERYTLSFLPGINADEMTASCLQSRKTSLGYCPLPNLVARPGWKLTTDAGSDIAVTQGAKASSFHVCRQGRV